MQMNSIEPPKLRNWKQCVHSCERCKAPLQLLCLRRRPRSARADLRHDRASE
jgi:hypothetical protein